MLGKINARALAERPLTLADIGVNNSAIHRRLKNSISPSFQVDNSHHTSLPANRFRRQCTEISVGPASIPSPLPVKKHFP